MGIPNVRTDSKWDQSSSDLFCVWERAGRRKHSSKVPFCIIGNVSTLRAVFIRAMAHPLFGGGFCIDPWFIGTHQCAHCGARWAVCISRVHIGRLQWRSIDFPLQNVINFAIFFFTQHWQNIAFLFHQLHKTIVVQLHIMENIKLKAYLKFPKLFSRPLAIFENSCKVLL